MTTLVVFEEKTKRVLASIPLQDGEPAILHEGIDFRIYQNGVEPVFYGINGNVKLKENAFFIELRDDNEKSEG